MGVKKWPLATKASVGLAGLKMLSGSGHSGSRTTGILPTLLNAWPRSSESSNFLENPALNPYSYETHMNTAKGIKKSQYLLVLTAKVSTQVVETN